MRGDAATPPAAQNQYGVFTRSQARAAGVSAKLKGTAKNVIFILMGGAPSHVDTFDLKVGAWTPTDFNPTTQLAFIKAPDGVSVWNMRR